jgi:hypothetical protein
MSGPRSYSPISGLRDKSAHGAIIKKTVFTHGEIGEVA